MSKVATTQSQAGGFKVKVQRFGRFLSGMVMPNIGAFIAWGLITALFIPTGWFPNESLAALVGPMITYLLPLLIGYTGGSMIHGVRGGVIGAVATMGVIVGADITMFLGAMIVAPIAAWILKKFDQAIEGKIPAGFEMLVNNFSSGIIGGALALLAYKAIGPVIAGLSSIMAKGVEFLVETGLLPLASILIEPGKVLFLNNAINHGILGPLALDQAAKAGQSVIYMLESNPGPGLGILLAFWLVGKGTVKSSAPGAAIIHFFGGIHEIYFPYILMKPALILAAIAGGAAGVFTFQIFGAGLVAAPSPGSIIAYFTMTPKGGHLGMLAGVLVATVVSFLIASLIIRTGKQKDEEDGSLEEAQAKMQEMKAQAKGTAAAPVAAATEVSYNSVQKAKADVNKIVFACDAGMGSSAMGASLLRKKLTNAGVNVQVINTAINDIPADADIVVTHQTLTERAKLKAPQAEHISIENFMKSPAYDEIVERLK
ncbi:PTS system mannitol-specific EIICB component [Paenibacillus montaniterrae]|uniref:PTS system mannitol-specific EIICB component n=1 Tax=Paenibacillus montaniterrae TaxID=429341 RepID=A0A920CYP3_9BACL|nr:PTS mannitol transporter subunit IICB [Paenibacillus montaniterrae]GIP16598.1 PTS system mannitol-specific EIICB component [Paenibacillus montaniterrae]